MSFRCGYGRIKLLPSKENVCLYCHCQTYSLKEVTRNSSSSCGKSNSGCTVRVVPSLQTTFECVLVWSFIYFGRRRLSSTCCRHWRIWEHLLDMRVGYCFQERTMGLAPKGHGVHPETLCDTMAIHWSLQAVEAHLVFLQKLTCKNPSEFIYPLDFWVQCLHIFHLWAIYVNWPQ